VKHPIVLLALALAGCPQPASWQVGVDLTHLRLVMVTPDVGVYPDTSVLRDANNPFAEGLTGDTKWQIESSGFPIPAFYAWATMLANEPTGEHQFYAAANLQKIYQTAQVDPDLLYYVHDNALRGYQVILDDFPDSVTYDPSGRVAYPLVPLAYQGILDLGGTPVGWTEVSTADGGTAVVPEGP